MNEIKNFENAENAEKTENIKNAENTESDVILECNKVSKSYIDAKSKLNVLKEVNLKVTLGEQIAIMGRSGSGKTTLLQLLGGLDGATTGEIKFLGQDWYKISDNKRCTLRNKGLGFIYQLHHLLPEFSALENVSMPLLLRKKSIKEIREKAEYILERVGLKDRLNHKPAQLSGGERQRVAIARALISNPKCILADEPTGNLDNHTASETFNLMLNINKEFKTTFIIVTHDLDLAKQLHTVYKLEKGVLSV